MYFIRFVKFRRFSGNWFNNISAALCNSASQIMPTPYATCTRILSSGI